MLNEEVLCQRLDVIKEKRANGQGMSTEEIRWLVDTVDDLYQEWREERMVHGFHVSELNKAEDALTMMKAKAQTDLKIAQTDLKTVLTDIETSIDAVNELARTFTEETYYHQYLLGKRDAYTHAKLVLLSLLHKI